MLEFKPRTALIILLFVGFAIAVAIFLPGCGGQSSRAREVRAAFQEAHYHVLVTDGVFSSGAPGMAGYGSDGRDKRRHLGLNHRKEKGDKRTPQLPVRAVRAGVRA